MTDTPSTYVLVHGAWHGGWAWDRVATPLRMAGHRVYTPTLTGLGECAHLLTPDVGLQTHVTDIVEVLEQHDLTDVILVGHSYAGFVVRGAADAVPHRIRRLVLVDAWVGADGTSMHDHAPAPFVTAMRDAAGRHGAGRYIPPPAPEQVGVHDPADIAWLRDRLTAHPLRTFDEPTRLTGAVDRIDTLAITATPGNAIPFAAWAHEFGWPVYEVASGHDVMVTAAPALTELLLRAADTAAVANNNERQ
ncbi:alpha/beta fold hydrolase [Nocardia sp. NPDC050710]|uniref:alpha/beta fold hydrolase n=1 Tax=Nocardia sp. NPDC050710 TaxID=3157220 RepID=UPI0034010108